VHRTFFGQKVLKSAQQSQCALLAAMQKLAMLQAQLCKQINPGKIACSSSNFCTFGHFAHLPKLHAYA